MGTHGMCSVIFHVDITKRRAVLPVCFIQPTMSVWNFAGMGYGMRCAVRPQTKVRGAVPVSQRP